MSRENFVLKAKNAKDGSPEYFHLGNVTRFKEVLDKDSKFQHTLVYSVGGEQVAIAETVEELERRGGSMAVLRVVK